MSHHCGGTFLEWSSKKLLERTLTQRTKISESILQLPELKAVNDPDLLKILIEINQWEDVQCRELQTISGRALYFKIAGTLIVNVAGKPQPLKLFNGRITDRATRTRIREFQEMGLVEVVDNEDDYRTKRVVPTDKFIKRLNHHLRLFKQLFDARYLMVNKIQK